MRDRITAPVLLIAFNRPDTTIITFESIRKVKPQKLYIAIDGPRNNKPDEPELCKEVLKITKQIDWDCEAKYLIREQNLGCKLGVTSAISWSLEKEERIIVIEDDIVAVPAFFSFAEELLEKYKDDERIAMISANQYTPIKMEDSYLFTKYGHIWGWATWKRVWDKFDVFLPDIESSVIGGLSEFSYINNSEHKYHQKYFSLWMEKILSKTENAWGPQFVFFRHRNNLLSIAPRVNLASNIGTTSSRTDNVAKINEHYFPADKSFYLLDHPKKVELNTAYDYHHFKKHIINKSTLIKRIFRKVKKILKLE